MAKSSLWKDVTAIFIVRIDSAERLRNLIATIKYYRSYCSGVTCRILEADKSSVVAHLYRAADPKILYSFVNDLNPIFHRTKYINIELSKTTTKYAIVVDVDIVVPIAQLVEAKSHLVGRRQVMVLPYDGRMVSVDPTLSEAFHISGCVDVFKRIQSSANLMFGNFSVGGIYVVDVAKYMSMGAENEYFIGWGPEDFERVHRLDILGEPPSRVHGVAYHLYHPRGVNSSNMNSDVAYSTRKEYSKVCSMMPNQLREYIRTWKWIPSSK